MKSLQKIQVEFYDFRKEPNIFLQLSSDPEFYTPFEMCQGPPTKHRIEGYDLPVPGHENPLLVASASRFDSVVFVDGSPAGYANSFVRGEDHCIVIGILYIHPDFRGQGIGRALLREMEFPQPPKSKSLKIWIDQANLPAKKFLEKCDFQLSLNEQSRDKIHGQVHCMVRALGESLF